MQTKPMIAPNDKICPSALKQVQALLNQYEWEVDQTDLSKDLKWGYTNGAEHFVRWLEGKFHPGSYLH